MGDLHIVIYIAKS